ncbi:hypothetical protein [Methylobacter sp. S3L5C]|uniref:hypothetical protein n=1 Tax=Methylobacter sp. S3L5C TaxID=2839024 RepID=UPI001FADC2B5|nr:hypothetical protein [Methylobacter sp. S3L5C]UOA10198.1 hypothetical protein KKZ03_08180 [Methylobacter sp. S3L5C]
MEDPIAVTQKLFDYCSKNDWVGYDPYDAINSKIFNLLPVLNTRIPRLVLTQVLKRSPINIRSLLLVPKTNNPKAMALFLMAFIKLLKLGLLDQKDLIPTMVNKLIAHRSQESSYWCWGYSFPWQTRTILVPRGSPNLVCTVFVANALLDVYELNREDNCLKMAVSAAEYILNELFWTKDDTTGSFAYPLPASQTPVHNANFLGAALLCRVYKLTDEKKFLEPALTVARYSAKKQHDDGSWDYGESPKQRWVDNFHTGYNLCALRSISQYVETSEFDTNIRRGFEFYRDHFFRIDGAPKYFHNHTFPIDIHSIAQSIITLLNFKDLDSNNLNLVYTIFNWSLKHMWDERGYFYYQVLPIGKNKISYIRWSQAWMLLALTHLIEESKQSSIG